MLSKSLFKKPRNPLEGDGKLTRKPAIPQEMCVACPGCKRMLFTSDLASQAYVCPKCSHHFRVNARQRLQMMLDEGSFFETDAGMAAADPLQFPGYEQKLQSARLDSALPEAVLCGFGRIGGYETGVFAMEPYFMMGSMGTTVGEKITRLFEAATEKSLPVVGWTVSGGARMQEGIFSLMQMAKTSGAVGRHSAAGNLYITVLTDPTTGGVTASFAMQGDITLAEPGALIGFAGPRVIEQTIRQKLPPGFQRAEFLLEKGFVDEIVDRRHQREYLARLLMLHGGRAADGSL